MAKNSETLAMEEIEYLNILKVSLLAFIAGRPQSGSRIRSGSSRAHEASFLEVEEVLRKGKK